MSPPRAKEAKLSHRATREGGAAQNVALSPPRYRSTRTRTTPPRHHTTACRHIYDTTAARALLPHAPARLVGNASRVEIDQGGTYHIFFFAKRAHLMKHPYRRTAPQNRAWPHILRRNGRAHPLTHIAFLICSTPPRTRAARILSLARSFTSRVLDTTRKQAYLLSPSALLRLSLRGRHGGEGRKRTPLQLLRISTHLCWRGTHGGDVPAF